MKTTSTKLSEFIEMEIDPGYAVLLNGAWGSGKTWEINQLIGLYANTTRKTCYISLNGVTSGAQISSLLYSELHPVLGGKAAKVGQKLLYTVLKNAVKIDLNDFASVTSTIDIANFFKEDADVTKPTILVFDDLERANMPIKEVLGYICRYIENSSARVIIVGNENEIKEKSDYLSIKEKVIGKTFKSTPDISTAYDLFVSQAKNEKIQTFLATNKDKIIDSFRLSESNNLRILKYGIMEWNGFAKAAALEQYLDKIEEFADVFFPVCFEYKLGRIEKGDLEKFQTYWKSDREEEPKCSIVMSKYQQIKRFRLILSPQSWDEYFGGGEVNHDEIAAYLHASGVIDAAPPPSWVRGWQYFSMSNSQIRELIPEIENHLFRQSSVNIGEYLHSVGIYLRMSADKLIRTNHENAANRIIKRLNSSRIRIIWLDDNSIYGLRDSYAGRGYQSSHTKEFQEIYACVDSLHNKWMAQNNIAKLTMAVGKLKADPADFYSLIGRTNGNYGMLHFEPILHLINPAKIVEYIIGASVDDVRILIAQFESRYSASNHSLFIEAGWLEGIKNAIVAKGRSKSGIEGKRLTKYYAKWLDATVEKAKTTTLAPNAEATL